MTGISLILLGTVALSNVGLLFYLLNDRNKKLMGTDKPVSNPEQNKEEAKNEPQSETASKPRVGKSRTVIDSNIEEYIQEQVNSRVKEEIRQLKESMLGDVRPEDVEFKESTEKPTTEEDVLTPHARMTKEEEVKAFEDVRINDVDGDMVSAPSATGTSFDEIEEALKTAENPNATPEEKAKAGDIFDKLMDTNLMDKITTDDEILKGVKACVSESIRVSFTEKEPRKVKAVIKNKTTILFPKDDDEFNPEDVFNL